MALRKHDLSPETV